MTNVFCPEGHHVCDACHSKSALEIIENFYNQTNIKDPFKIADKIISHPKFSIYGPEHHLLVPAVILTALKK